MRESAWATKLVMTDELDLSPRHISTLPNLVGQTSSKDDCCQSLKRHSGDALVDSNAATPASPMG